MPCRSCALPPSSSCSSGKTKPPGPPAPLVPVEDGADKYFFQSNGWQELTGPQVEISLPGNCVAASVSSRTSGFRLFRNIAPEQIDRHRFFSFCCPWVTEHCKDKACVSVDVLRPVYEGYFGSDPSPGCREPCSLCDQIQACANVEHQNIALGLQTLTRGMDQGIGNSAFGMGALANLTGPSDFTSSANNTAIGYLALNQNSTGTSNTAVGATSLNNNTTGGEHTAVGAFALESNTTGERNTGLGAFALTNNTTGSGNTSVGVESLYENTTGASNVAVGQGAMVFNTTGSSNTAAGTTALFRNTTGDNNAAFGGGALENNTTGGNNVAVGTTALFRNTTGDNNAAFGVGALENNTGSDNVAVGSKALYSLDDGTTAGATSNVALGAQAGAFLATGNGNVFLGPFASHEVTGGSNNTVVGASATSAGFSGCIALGSGATATSDNQLVLQGVTVDDPVGPTPELRITLNGIDYKIALVPA